MSKPKFRGKDLIPFAKQWYDRGVINVPVYYASKRPTIFWGNINEFPQWETVRDWFNSHLLRGLSVLCGPISGNLVVIDFDTPLGYIEFMSKNQVSTYCVQSARGYHVYVRVSSLDNNSTYLVPRCDIKTSGLVVAPPSTHPTGFQYKTECGCLDSILSINSLDDLGIIPNSSEISSLTLSRSPGSPSTGSLVNIVRAIKENYRIEKLLSQYMVDGLEQGDGRWVMAYCPFHDDEKASMWIDIENQICACFRKDCAAGKGPPMDVINVWSLLNEVSNNMAIQQMGYYSGI